MVVGTRAAGILAEPTRLPASFMSGPFIPPKIILDGFKERAEALTVQGILLNHEFPSFSWSLQGTDYMSAHRLETYTYILLIMLPVRTSSIA